MSNHLRELLDTTQLAISAEEGEWWIAASKQAFADLAADAEHAVCFFVGDAEDLGALNSRSMFDMPAELPFEVTWVEYTHEGEPFGVMCRQTEPGEIRMSVYRKAAGVWGYLFTGDTGKNMRGVWIDASEKSIEGQVGKSILTILRIAFIAMQCVNIDKVEHTPPAKLQKARARRGKKPFYSYWTLEINVNKSREVGESHGGTHASPRFHLRRGHVRHLKSGKYCWVQSCAVGNKKNGEIHKDYELRVGA